MCFLMDKYLHCQGQNLHVTVVSFTFEESSHFCIFTPTSHLEIKIVQSFEGDWEKNSLILKKISEYPLHFLKKKEKRKKTQDTTSAA